SEAAASRLNPGSAGYADRYPILGVFAEPLIGHERYVRMVGREKLMASDLLTYLMEEKLAEMRAEKDGQLAQLQAEKDGQLAQLQAEKDGQLAQLQAEKDGQLAELAELAAKKEAERALALRQLQQTLEEAVIARFPEAPIAL